MKHRTILATLTLLSALIVAVVLIFMLAKSATPVQAAADDDYGELSLSNSAGPICTQLIEAGGFEGNPDTVFQYWVAGDDEAFQRSGYLQYEGAFSMRLHASRGSYPACTALNPWLYQAVRIPAGISATTRITVEGYYAIGGSQSDCSVYNSTDADDVLYVQIRDAGGTPISDPITITHGGGVTETWEHFSADFTDDMDLESLAGQNVQIYFYATHDGDEYGTWFYLDDLECNVCPHQPTPELTISKTGPSSVKSGERITYTLTITNHGSITSTHLSITDVVPSRASVVEPVPGGTVDLLVVIWTVDQLAPHGATVNVQFAVAATQTITNNDYCVSCAEGVSAAGATMVVTHVEWYNVYLPLVLRQFP
jgi:uncharacterized repeat protein (TIGR01451 family)